MTSTDGTVNHRLLASSLLNVIDPEDVLEMLPVWRDLGRAAYVDAPAGWYRHFDISRDEFIRLTDALERLCRALVATKQEASV